jgi:NADP-dependent 3-hydroxy acid dehydrogenase YdfG
MGGEKNKIKRKVVVNTGASGGLGELYLRRG